MMNGVFPFPQSNTLRCHELSSLPLSAPAPVQISMTVLLPENRERLVVFSAVSVLPGPEKIVVIKPLKIYDSFLIDDVVEQACCRGKGGKFQVAQVFFDRKPLLWFQSGF